MSKGVPLKQAAKALKVDLSTLQRAIQDGMPVVRKGRRGPGGSALVDLQQVMAYRGTPSALDPDVVPDPDVVLKQIAEALLACVHEDLIALRTGCDSDDAIALLLVVWKRMCRSFGRAYPFDEQPEAIYALKHKLYR